MLELILLITFVLLLFNFPVATLSFIIGSGLILWSIYKLLYNKKQDAKSKIPAIILSIAILIIVGGMGIQASVGSDTAIEKDSIIKEKEIEKTEKVEKKSEEAIVTKDVKENKEDKTDKESIKVLNKSNEEVNDNKEKVVEEKKKESSSTEKVEEKTKPKQDSSATGETATVTRIVDGDTIEINYNGKTESVRLLLVDTPETKHPNLPVQPFGPEATAFAEKHLAGKTVQVEFDGPKRDKYDRLLAYLWIGGKNFNQMLLENGLARYAYVYDPPYKHQDEMKAAESRAKEKRIGIWSIDNYVSADGFNASKPESKPKAESKPKTTASKPKTESKPKPKPKAEPKPESNPEPKKEQPTSTENFKNCTELKMVYPDGVPSDHPAYQPKMDRDKDNWACE